MKLLFPEMRLIHFWRETNQILVRKSDSWKPQFQEKYFAKPLRGNVVLRVLSVIALVFVGALSPTGFLALTAMLYFVKGSSWSSVMNNCFAVYSFIDSISFLLYVTT